MLNNNIVLVDLDYIFYMQNNFSLSSSVLWSIVHFLTDFVVILHRENYHSEISVIQSGRIPLKDQTVLNHSLFNWL